MDETSTTETTETLPGTTTGASTEADTGTILGGDTSTGTEAADTVAASEGEETVAGAEGEDTLEAASALPDKYELTAPEGFTIDPALMEAVTPDFKDAGLTNDQAQKLLPAAVKFAESLKQQGEQQLIGHVLAERKAWAEEAKADKEIGGAKWDETLAMSAKALDALPDNVGQPLRALLNDSGLGNKREMIAAMSFFGRSIGEDSTIQGEGRGAAEVSVAHRLYPNDVPKGG